MDAIVEKHGPDYALSSADDQAFVLDGLLAAIKAGDVPVVRPPRIAP